MNNRMAFVSMICLYLVIAACAPQADSLREQEVTTIVWQALEPNTSSHDQAAWDIIDTRLVTGRDVQDQFEGEPVPGGCVSGSPPPDNAIIAEEGSYWYVQLKPRPATSMPEPTEQYSPTAPPHVPEPLIYEANFLVDAATGEIVARKIFCVIY